jgi:hypothetical protein
LSWARYHLSHAPKLLVALVIIQVGSCIFFPGLMCFKMNLTSPKSPLHRMEYLWINDQNVEYSVLLKVSSVSHILGSSMLHTLNDLLLMRTLWGRHHFLQQIGKLKNRNQVNCPKMTISWLISCLGFELRSFRLENLAHHLFLPLFQFCTTRQIIG